MQELIKEYIILPMAIKTLQHDRELLKGRNALNIYWSKIDHVIGQMQQRHNDIKRQLIGKHKVRVNAYKEDNVRRYAAGDQTYEYTSDQLKDMTTALIRTYLKGNRATDFEVGWYEESLKTDQDFIKDFSKKDML
ncbi:hypothetical protein BN988_01586 [Oceanobacillus picturae]|uniref:Uncharacterized protein n=1 Tax=Oceanobacillus picturae TaxID=171693 RepID=W9AKB3_9BACI|nr:hypothetical protein [Oceanobacillus picturae]CDO03086.1 hypothetical protein BN988_01586 [Oceanobacillus picturae]